MTKTAVEIKQIWSISSHFRLEQYAGLFLIHNHMFWYNFQAYTRWFLYTYMLCSEWNIAVLLASMLSNKISHLYGDATISGEKL